MQKKTAKTVALTVLVTLLFELCLTAMFFPVLFPGDSFSDKVDRIDKILENRCLYELDKNAATENMLKAYIGTLNDIHSAYYTAEEYSRYQEEQQGNFTGIGLTMLSVDVVPASGFPVYRVLGNSPAEKAGILPGDGIISVNGQILEGLDYNTAFAAFTGDDNSSFSLEILRGEETLFFNVSREKFLQREVDYRIIGDIGFVRIHEFNLNAYEEFSSALRELLSSGVKGFVFDVRNNPGGDLNTVCSMVDLLVAQDEMVILQYSDDEEIIRSTGNRMTDLPMTVLLNRSSASASEMFSSCLRDMNGSLLVGEVSYGKGVGQTTLPLSDGSALHITTFRYMTKSRTDYNGIGLIPDEEVSLPAELAPRFYSMTDAEDLQLAKALELLGAEK